MKKEILKIGKALSRFQQKQINGGSGTCSACTNVGMTLFDNDHFSSGSGSYEDTHCFGGLITGVSISEAETHVQGGGSWCCDSCNQAHWSHNYLTAYAL